MARYVKRLGVRGFGDFSVPDYQLFPASSDTGVSSGFTSPAGSSEELGWTAAPSSGGGGSAIDFTKLGTALIGAGTTITGNVLSYEAATHQQPASIAPYQMQPPGTVAGSVNSTLLLLAGVALVAILVMQRKA